MRRTRFLSCIVGVLATTGAFLISPSSARAQAVLQKQAPSAHTSPCAAPEFRQFDFWVGDWDASSTADGILRGTSHISKEMGGCVIWENWTSTGSPFFGKSYNTYNVNLQRWEQCWVDNAGGS